MAMLMVSPSVGRDRLRRAGPVLAVSVRLSRLDRTSYEKYVWFCCVGTLAAAPDWAAAARDRERAHNGKTMDLTDA